MLHSSLRTAWPHTPPHRAWQVRFAALACAILPLVACASAHDAPPTDTLGARRQALGKLGVAPAAPKVDLVLPTTARGAVRLSDEGRQVTAAITLRGTTDVRPVTSDGVSLYRGALSGADLVHATLSDGVEDFVFFDAKPAREELVYDVDMARVAGLRLVDDTLEFLDSSGAPRLRAAPPFLVDAHGARVPAHTAVEGCAFDESAAAPWDRPVLASGASTCRVRVTWGKDSAIQYPAVVDPAWQGTASPSGARYGYALGVLASGRILIVGGFYEPDGGMGRETLSSAELFDPATRTWAAAGSLTGGRQDFVIGNLPSGKLLIIGGNGSSRPDIYTPGVGLSRSNEFVAQPTGLTATLLGNGKLLVAGGSTGAAIKTALLYDDATDLFSNAGPTGELGTARERHTATKLVSGKVLFAGGDSAGGPLVSAELYDPATNAFAPTGPMQNARSGHSATLLADGRVLVAGGGTAAAELYDPATGTFGPAGTLSSARTSTQAVLLASGRVMVAGGELGFSAVGDVEIFDPTTRSFSTQPPLSFARSRFGMARLSTDEVLAIGGKAPNATSVRNAEMWRPSTKGTSCSVGDDCGSGVCQEGVCCAGPCAGPCKTCARDTGACIAVVLADDPDACTGTTTCDAVGACKKKNGLACGAAGDCASGFCIDGFCCEKACSGQCEACDVGGNEGRCIPVAGETHGARPRCAKGDAKCGGACNGVSPVECAFPSAVTTCAQTCTSKLTTISTCDGRGTCVGGAPQSCPGNFVCANATSCKTECAGDTDCLDGYRCENKRCNAIALCKGSIVTKGPESVDCGPYTCEQSGVCRTSCASVAECTEPNLCSADGVCIPAPAPPTASCAMARGSGKETGAPWAAVAAVLLGVFVSRRRR